PGLDGEALRVGFARLHEPIDADDDALAGLHLLHLAHLVLFAPLLDDVVGDGLDDADLLDLGQQPQGFGLDVVGEFLDVPGPAEGVGDPGAADLVGHDLLGADGDLAGFVGGDADGFVVGADLHRLHPAAQRGQHLRRAAHDVVQRLLVGHRAAGGVAGDPQPHGTLVGGAAAVAQGAGPDPAQRPELGDLFEEVDAGGGYPGQRRGDLVGGHTARGEIGQGLVDDGHA